MIDSAMVLVQYDMPQEIEIEMGDAFRLGLTMARMRANPKARATWECEIVDGQGMHVVPRQIPAALIRPCSSDLNQISRNPARHEDPKDS